MVKQLSFLVSIYLTLRMLMFQKYCCNCLKDKSFVFGCFSSCVHVFLREIMSEEGGI